MFPFHVSCSTAANLRHELQIHDKTKVNTNLVEYALVLVGKCIKDSCYGGTAYRMELLYHSQMLLLAGIIFKRIIT